MSAAVGAVLLAWGSNALLKTGVAYWAGTRGFAGRVTLGFGVMLGAAVAAWWWGG